MTGNALHKLMPQIVDADPDIELAFQRSSVGGDRVVAHFGDVTEAATEFVRGSSVIFGCVAWLTSFPILDALANVEDVAI